MSNMESAFKYLGTVLIPLSGILILGWIQLQYVLKMPNIATIFLFLSIVLFVMGIGSFIATFILAWRRENARKHEF